MSLDYLPRTTDMIPVDKKGIRADAKPAIERALKDLEVQAACEKYLVNGGVEGAPLLDLRCILDEVIVYDDKHAGGTIRALMPAVKRAVLIDQLRTVLRRFWTLDKKAKVTGINPKRYALASNQSATRQ